MKKNLVKKIDRLIGYDLALCDTTVKASKRTVAKRFRIPARQAAKIVKNINNAVEF